VFILGTGTIGTIILQTCKAIGATVICSDISDETLERAKHYGADFIINSKKEDIVSRVREITNGKGVTIAYDAACFKGSLTMLFEKGLVRNAGRIVPLGFVTEPEAISQAMINQRELDVIGTRMSAYQFKPVIKAFEERKYDTKGIVTDFISFKDIDQVFYKMDNLSGKPTKMVIVFD
jgi:L-gulonate 5-dehydrogenase